MMFHHAGLYLRLLQVWQIQKEELYECHQHKANILCGFLATESATDQTQ